VDFNASRTNTPFSDVVLGVSCNGMIPLYISCGSMLFEYLNEVVEIEPWGRAFRKEGVNEPWQQEGTFWRHIITCL
jgi:hypothetical protein